MDLTGPVLLATCADFPDGDEEEAGPLLPACARAGLDVRWAVWDDPGVDWSAAAATVVRSTWDYTNRRPEFLAWARCVPRLFNRAAVLQWNSDKTYLRDLAAAGIPIVPTTWVPPVEPVDVVADVDVGVVGDGDVVVKPSIGAGSRGVGRFACTDPAATRSARAHIAYLHSLDRTAMIQPYVQGVDRRGETAMVFIGGEFSHAAGKAALLPEPVVHQVTDQPPGELFVAELITPRRPEPAELEVAQAVLAAACATLDTAVRDLLYARVDLVPGPHGPLLIELELTEPSLFLQVAPAAADRLASAIARLVARIAAGPIESGR